MGRLASRHDGGKRVAGRVGTGLNPSTSAPSDADNGMNTRLPLPLYAAARAAAAVAGVLCDVIATNLADE